MSVICEWDVSLTPLKKQLVVYLPTALSASLRDAGMLRARLVMTDDCLEVRPYQGDYVSQSSSVPIPEGWKK